MLGRYGGFKFIVCKEKMEFSSMFMSGRNGGCRYIVCNEQMEVTGKLYVRKLNKLDDKRDYTKSYLCYYLIWL